MTLDQQRGARHQIRSSALRGCAVLGAALVCVGCPSATTPTGPIPVISCPASATGQSVDGSAVAVTFAPPIVSGGTAPVTTSCTPSAFPVGTTKATCTARDAKQQVASCTFAVTVVKVPQLAATKFVAFGDSITSGVVATSCPVGGGVSCAAPTLGSRWTQQIDDLRLLYPTLGEESPVAYPRQLQTMLSARFAAQTITMVNEGSPGEFIAEGKARLPSTLTRGAPQVLLLQEGANDLNQARPSISSLVSDLRAMVQEGRRRGLDVFVGTALPQRPLACRGYDFCDGVADVVPLNAQIRTMVVAEGAVLVDLFPLFEGQTLTLLGLDGLHPNEAGYQRMADAFFMAIRQRFEN